MIVINIKNVEETKKKAAIVFLHFFIRMKIDRQPSIKYKKKLEIIHELNAVQFQQQNWLKYRAIHSLME